jgi:hypothetical protein
MVYLACTLALALTLALASPPLLLRDKMGSPAIERTPSRWKRQDPEDVAYNML